MQNHRNATFENEEHEIFQNHNRNQLGGDCLKLQEMEEACERKLVACDFTVSLTSGVLESKGIEQKMGSKMLEWHLNSLIQSEFQDSSTEPDICDLSGAYSSGFSFDMRCSNPLTSTPCSRKKRVSFQVDEDCNSMNDSGYDGSPTSEKQSPIVSLKRDLEVSRYDVLDSFEEDLGANLSLDLENPRFSLLSRFDEPGERDSADVSYSDSSSSLAHLTTDCSEQDDVSEDFGKTETVYPEHTKDFQISTNNIGDVQESSQLTDASPASPENSGTVHALHQNKEISHISPEMSAPVFDSPPSKLTSCHVPEKNDSGFVELTDLVANLSISDLNAASILYANSPEFSLARKVISTKEYNDRLMKTLQHFAPPCLDRLIGRKMGLDKVDVISELYFRNITGVLSTILNYLGDDDLQRYGVYMVFLSEGNI